MDIVNWYVIEDCTCRRTPTNFNCYEDKIGSKMSKLIKLNYTCCKNLLENSNTGSRFVCVKGDQYIALVDLWTNLGIFISPTMCEVTSDLEISYSRAFSVSQDSYTRIYYKVEEILELLDKLTKQYGK